MESKNKESNSFINSDYDLHGGFDVDNEMEDKLCYISILIIIFSIIVGIAYATKYC